MTRGISRRRFASMPLRPAFPHIIGQTETRAQLVRIRLLLRHRC
jgi:hypothetical protein